MLNKKIFKKGIVLYGEKRIIRDVGRRLKG